MLNKTSFSEINKTNRRQIVLFGSGNIAEKTIRKIGIDKIAFIVDSSQNLQGTRFNNLEIFHPNRIEKTHFVIICSTAITDISNVLQGFGLSPNEDFTISPILNDLLAIIELETLKSTFYFTSGTASKENLRYGGGLYKCSILGTEISLERIFAGACYGATTHGENIVFVDTDKGILEYDGKNISKKCDLPKNSRAHGISFNEANRCFYVTCSYLDSILEFNENFELLRTFLISKKINKSGVPMHHCNDNLAVGNSLYVSMFSSTGNWKNDCFDGCVAEFSLETGDRLGDICAGLYMPHNIKFYDGSLHILDSLPGHLRFNNFSVQGTFPAFARGLAYADGLYFIGQSKNRNYSKVLGLSNNISIDCGVIVFNPELKVSRFLQFSNEIGEIHSVSFTS